MKNDLGKKTLFIIICIVLLLLTWGSTTLADTELSSFVYSAYLHFPGQISGCANFTGDCLISGSTLSLTAGYFGLEVDLATGIAWDEWNDEYDSVSPLLWSGNLIFYPFSQAYITPYVKIGYGGIYTWLELENDFLSGFYFFGRNDLGGGINFRGDSSGNYFFIEYLYSTVWGDWGISGFHLSIYKVGYVVVY